MLAGAHAQQCLFSVHLGGRAKNDGLNARLGNGFSEFRGDMVHAVLVGGGAGGCQITAHQRHHFDVADELHGIQVLLAEGAGTGKNDLHHVFSRMR